MAEERKDMRSEYVVAAVSVLIALLGIAGTLLVTAREETGEAERAQEEFVRGQRRDAYADLLSTIVDHEEERDRFADTVVDLTEPPGAGDLEESYANYAVTYDKLVLAIHRVKMMGSDDLLSTLDEVQASHHDVHDTIGAAMELTREGHGDELVHSDVREVMKAGFKEELAPLPEAMDRFIDVARDDLGLRS